jgi:hypothetical protein
LCSTGAVEHLRGKKGCDAPLVPFRAAFHTCCMSTYKQRLEKQQAATNARQRKRRTRLKARGRPDTTVTDSAIVEAIAFVLAREGLSEIVAGETFDSKALRRPLRISPLDIRDIALEILVERKNFNGRETRVALDLRLGARPQHEEASYVPSLRPDIGARARRLT